MIKQHALVVFCALTIAFTFASTLLPQPGEAVAVVMVFIPAFMAIALTASPHCGHPRLRDKLVLEGFTHFMPASSATSMANSNIGFTRLRKCSV